MDLQKAILSNESNFQGYDLADNRYILWANKTIRLFHDSHVEWSSCQPRGRVRAYPNSTYHTSRNAS